jgi:GABA(A) receptor-associated protein
MAANFRFKQGVPDLDDRKRQAVQAINQHPGKLPVILERLGDSELNELPKCKYLLPASAPVSHIVQLLQSWHELPSAYDIRIIADGTIIDRTKLLSAIYTEYREPDYFLYLSYKEVLRGENSL